MATAAVIASLVCLGVAIFVGMILIYRHTIRSKRLSETRSVKMSTSRCTTTEATPVRGLSRVDEYATNP